MLNNDNPDNFNYFYEKVNIDNIKEFVNELKLILFDFKISVKLVKNTSELQSLFKNISL